MLSEGTSQPVFPLSADSGRTSVRAAAAAVLLLLLRLAAGEVLAAQIFNRFSYFR